MRCQSCNIATINGVRCHETGCPDAWRDHQVACRVCGCDFRPEQRGQTVCADCANPPEIEPMETDPVAIAEMWWSVMTWNDPGVCMYAFGSTGRVQSKKHRAQLLRYIDKDCVPKCADNDPPEDPGRSHEELMILRRHIEKAPIEPA